MKYKRRFVEDDIMARKGVEKMKRCFNCNKLIVGENRDVCEECLAKTIKQDKAAIIRRNNEKNNNRS